MPGLEGVMQLTPAGQAVQLEAPPAECVPGGQNRGGSWDTGQNEPAGHMLHLTFVPFELQKPVIQS